jgi:predicted nucleotidyltransferase component of viral defense system
MAFGEIYTRQVSLLIRALPFVAEEPCFALKGGTAINLFIRDMPRLSVDIDLAYIPIAPHAESLQDIDSAMRRIAARIRNGLRGAKVNETILKEDGAVYKLVVSLNGVQILIEVTPVLRGCVFDGELRGVSAQVEEAYGFAEINTLSFADLYGGKIVAALDRQHPRDLFDIRELFANEGVDDRLREAFIAYLISHNRPMHEVLASKQKDIRDEFERGFKGMTRDEVDLSALLEARAQMTNEVVGQMLPDHRGFLISFERGVPDWSLLNVEGVDKLPAVQWRMQNLSRLSADRRNQLLAGLEAVLS